MNFHQYNKAVDKVKGYGLTERVALDIVNDMVDIFELQGEESEEDVLGLLVQMLNGEL